jgi:hypothetical protein
MPYIDILIRPISHSQRFSGTTTNQLHGLSAIASKKLKGSMSLRPVRYSEALHRVLPTESLQQTPDGISTHNDAIYKSRSTCILLKSLPFYSSAERRKERIFKSLNEAEIWQQAGGQGNPVPALGPIATVAAVAPHFEPPKPRSRIPPKSPFGGACTNRGKEMNGCIFSWEIDFMCLKTARLQKGSR